MNNLHKIIFAFVAGFILLFTVSCSDDTAMYLGTWKRLSDGDSLYRGFTLGNNGIAASVNNSATQYKAWHRKSDTLWLSGKYYSDTSVTPFIDTMIVQTLSHDSLVVLFDGEILRFFHE